LKESGRLSKLGMRCYDEFGEDEWNGMFMILAWSDNLVIMDENATASDWNGQDWWLLE